jgi:DNA processing protein
MIPFNWLIVFLKQSIRAFPRGVIVGCNFTLITARCASEQGREVFFVPCSPLDPRSEGCNRLIREDATLLMSSRDVIDGVKLLQPKPDNAFAEREEHLHDVSAPAERDRETILELLSLTPVDADTLIRESGLSAPIVASLLLELELAGRATRLPHGLVSIAEPAPA